MSAPTAEGRWPVWKLAAVMYPFAAGAAAVNLFFIGLMVQAIGLTAISTQTSILLGLVFGVPFAWLSGRWLRSLIDQAEDDT